MPPRENAIRMLLSLHPQVQATLRLGVILGEYTPPAPPSVPSADVSWASAASENVAVEVLAPDTAPGAQQLSAAIAAAETLTREAYDRVQAVHEVADVALVRHMFHECGMDPTRDRPSSEVLLRRVMKGDSLPRINTIVDTNNLSSLELLLPIGSYDAFRLVGDAICRFGRTGETLEAIDRRLLDVNGVLALVDELGPFGSPLSDGLRTMVRATTTRVLTVLFIPRELPARLAETRTHHAAQRLEELAGVRLTDTHVVS